MRSRIEDVAAAAGVSLKTVSRVLNNEPNVREETRGIAVPRDLSVCGFEDTPIARHIYLALTTVRQPTSDMGRLATLELLERIRTPGAGRMVHVEHTLLFRESTRPPKQR